ncbi:thyroid transcription factor 1-associated protein 26 homolog [Acipenser ruthenus]|uniref:thyroid transcription factor 1-associated protein 26 homolog n=1 Tax=Acipenser ruthenus TaxID=7906 RepID=UPI00274056B6|nr:thyroid transcription factor 1-associated protein 26 homolog [Acipenser ruthenus]
MASAAKLENTKKAAFSAHHAYKNKGQLPSSASIMKTKRKWIPPDKAFAGSVKEGQGFAFHRKQKVQYEYKKLLRKERRAKSQPVVQYTDSYPEHLKHLYLAEEEMIKNEEQQKKKERRARDVNPLPEEAATPASTTTVATSTTSDTEPKRPDKKEQKFKKTSYQKTKEEYEWIQTKRAQKRREAEKNKQQRQEALRIYKQKKMETYQILSRKTKKGQPNLNVQMEYLLQKIQDNQSKGSK